MNQNQKQAIKLWEWLVNHPGCEKDDAYEALNLDYDFGNPMSSSCPACTEADKRAKADGELRTIDYAICKYCPLKGRWPGVRGGMRHKYCYDDREGSGFDVATSRTAFDRWCNATHEIHVEGRYEYEPIASKQAGYIVKALKEGWK